LDVSVSRHMGLFAVARLAKRHGVRVRLRSRSPQGLTALVWLPDSVTERKTGLFSARSRTFGVQAGSQTRGTEARRDVIVPEHAGTGPRETIPSGATGTVPSGAAVPSGATVSSGATVPAAASAATSGWFRGRSSSGAGGTGNGSPWATGGPDLSSGTSGTDRWAVGKHAAHIVAEPVRGDLTAAGLPTRVPQANLIPGSAGGGRPMGDGRSMGGGRSMGDGRLAGGGAAGRRGPGSEGREPITPRSPRSPDLARNRLSGFQRGARRAKGLDTPVTPTPEGEPTVE
jgi:hypothetical protein